jgi:hypothetical protein
MSTIQELGYGTLRVLPEGDPPGVPLTIALDHPNGRTRVTLSRVPTGKAVILVAVRTVPATDIGATVHFANAVATGFTLGSGLVWSNQPAPGLGPVDRISVEPDRDWPGWNRDMLARLDGRRISLEAHPPGCSCGRGLTLPGPRSAPEQEAA